MKNTPNEVKNLLSLIWQGGEVRVEGGHLLVSPPSLAAKFADQIRRLKPEILLALGHCPKCGAELIVKIETNHIFPDRDVPRRHVWCQAGIHYDKWERT